VHNRSSANQTQSKQHIQSVRTILQVIFANSIYPKGGPGNEDSGSSFQALGPSQRKTIMVFSPASWKRGGYNPSCIPGLCNSVGDSTNSPIWLSTRNLSRELPPSEDGCLTSWQSKLAANCPKNLEFSFGQSNTEFIMLPNK